MEKLKLTIKDAISTGFVDENIESFIDYRPSILTNEPSLNEKVLTTILDELRSCESFFLSVAFITTGGVASLFGTLLDLESRGINGKILVSEYLNFTEPEALRKLLQLSNVELKIARDTDFHSKGFLFSHSSYYTIIIGSSNITQGALTKNKEWNLRVTAHQDSELFKLTFSEFEKVFSMAYTVNEDYLAKYTFIHQAEKRLRQNYRKSLLGLENKKIEPNDMQKAALLNIQRLRDSGKNKALLVSATGTGKTYLSAFDVASLNPKRMLFLVHRKNIAQKALESYKSIMGNGKQMDLYSSSLESKKADYIFSTIQTFSRSEHLKEFAAEHFDYIVIDETHRANAVSYQKIMNHFNPKFLLGMTATPERTDGLDVFALFDYNIAYEIRLQDALAYEMLTPFHYYGISDIQVNGQLLDEKATIHDLNRKDRVHHIIEKIRLFGTDDGTIRGLIFCSRQEECEFLSNEFNLNGFKTIFLTGKSSDSERSKAIDLLESDDLEVKLDYIFTVDIFNEGIDIPRVNQIVMLRPTQSAIIFVQQLGRGLRKREGKSYLTVIDFIGNYQNNFLVPIALFGDRSYVKDNLRKLVNRPEKSIAGASTIYFDRIVKERIFHSIDTGKLQEKRKLVEEYKLLKGKIGRIPSMMDFVEHGERNPYQYILSYDSYYIFLLAQGENLSPISDKEKKLLIYLSKEILNPIRYVDIHLLKTILEKKIMTVQEYQDLYLMETNTSLDRSILNHAIHHINGLFVTISENGGKVKIGKSRGYEIIHFNEELIEIGESLKSLIKLNVLYEHILDFCRYSTDILVKQSEDCFKNDFILGQRYTRKDVFRILLWDENPVAQNVGGYMIAKNKKDCAIFVNYDKDEDISATTKYHDRFISRNEFVWMSKSKRRLNSPDVSTILQQNQLKMRIPLFVKKSNIEGGAFYFLGDLSLIENSAVEKNIPDDSGKSVSVVEMTFQLENPVEKSLYDYITTSN